jgi:hypothetical protein
MWDSNLRMKTARSFIFALTLFLGLSQGSVAMAYTGAYGAMPAMTGGGPGSSYVNQFDLNTEAGPATILMNMYYVHSMVIETDREIDDHILIKEYPAGSENTFDIIVPQPVQNALVSATVYIWAADTETLTIRHEHSGEPTQYVTASKVQPVTEDGNGNVLWSFTVSSFSSFSFFNPLAQHSTWNFFTIGAWFLLIWFAALAPMALRDR